MFCQLKTHPWEGLELQLEAQVGERHSDRRTTRGPLLKLALGLSKEPGNGVRL